LYLHFFLDIKIIYDITNGKNKFLTKGNKMKLKIEIDYEKIKAKSAKEFYQEINNVFTKIFLNPRVCG